MRRHSPISILSLIVLTIGLVSVIAWPHNAAAITYNICLRDDSSGISLQINTSTGDYKFKRCGDGFTLTGIGSMTGRGNDWSLQDNVGDRRVTASWSYTTLIGHASLQFPPGTTIITITDRNIGNNNCGS
jgi:hypothetical protein